MLERADPLCFQHLISGSGRKVPAKFCIHFNSSSPFLLHIYSQASEDVARKIYVGGIPYYSSEDDIRSYFEGCGTITEIDCMTFPESGKFRGIAIISFKVSH